MNDVGILKGHIKLELIGPDGKVKDVREVDNTVKDYAKYSILDKILASPTLTTKPTHMELGTGSPAATLLGAYVAGSRTALDSKVRADAVITMVCTFPAGTGTGTITEAGIFDVATQNTINMWLSASFGAITKAAGDGLVVTWTLTQA